MSSAVGAKAWSLPELAAPNTQRSAGFKLDQDRLGFGYAGKEAKWGAELDSYASAGRSLTLDYGLRMHEMLGVGTRLNYRNDYVETLASGVLAPARNLRIQLTAGELRSRSCGDDTACGWNARAQDSYLVGFKHRFSKTSLLSALSYTVYSVADRTGAEDFASSEAGEGEGAGWMHGRMRGHVLNLKLRPTLQSTVEFRGGRGSLAFYATDGSRDREELAYGGVRFTRYFNNCLELRGRFSTAPGAQRVALDMARHNWSMSLALADMAGAADMSVRVAYSIPLRSERQARACSLEGSLANPFTPLSVAAAGRPALIPDMPLTATDSGSLIEQIVGW